MTTEAVSSRFTFADLFAGIGGMRRGLERAGGTCVFSVEIDRFARLTYEENWGPLDAADVKDVAPADLKNPDLLAAGFPCQPFSLAGVSKKVSLGRAHGFEDPKSGNLFFEIIRLVGGPWDLGPAELAAEADPAIDDAAFASEQPSSQAPPILLLENVRHLLTHDQRRTFRVIKRRLMRSGYRVQEHRINSAAWVPQNRWRTVITAVRADVFGSPLLLPPPPDPVGGPKLSASDLEQDPDTLARYRLTPGTWAALERHMARHAAKGNGFGRGVAQLGSATRTLSARYYKDGAEILIPMADELPPPRRLTPDECAMLMGFTREHLGVEFRLPRSVSDSQAYRQFGNSVVVPQFTWAANRIMEAAGSQLDAWRRSKQRVA
jgi:DNA (cytosine-5)-methyltransferase 1